MDTSGSRARFGLTEREARAWLATERRLRDVTVRERVFWGQALDALPPRSSPARPWSPRDVLTAQRAVKRRATNDERTPA